MSNHQPQSAGAGPPSAGMGMQHVPPGGTPAPAQNMSQQNLNQIVIEYLLKKGYNRTERTLRAESSALDREGNQQQDRVEDIGNIKYSRGLRLLFGWISGNLDIYKYELSRILWPVFVYSFLDMVVNDDPIDADNFLREFRDRFEKLHSDELRTLSTIKLRQHAFENSLSNLYRTSKYRIPLNEHLFHNLLSFLEANGKEGGTVIIYLLQTYCEIRTTTRGPLDKYSFDAITNQSHGTSQEPDFQEGIPGAFTGVTNKDIMDNKAVLKLGMMPMEPELAGDVRAALDEEDLLNPPELGRPSLVEEFDRAIKREGSEGPSRNEIPLPASRARDVVMEIQKVKEYRDRFKIEGRTGGIGPAVSVCMFTFHNTYDCLTCIEFSDDTKMVAVGTQDSTIRVWNVDGSHLPSLCPSDNKPTASRLLIGHSAPVYGVSFSPSIDGPENADENTPSTAPKTLLSCSADGTIRMWNLQTWTALAVYKGHDGPVFGVRWGPHGHYFASCGHDKTVRVWAQDRISYCRMMVGHDSAAIQVAWHPNGAYVFSASDFQDKTVRMWSMVTGECVRVFHGHTEFPSALECSPDGKTLASADGSGTIILWDLASGTEKKRCKGHGKGGVWSLSFCVESTVLVSGGADGTVRLWDAKVADGQQKNADGEIIGTGGQAEASRINVASAGAPSSAAAGGGKKKGKETMITADQISAFPTKKTPVFKVKFTRMNLVMAGGCYNP